MIDFANAKSIIIPEGEVAIIARGSEILWQKQKYKKELFYIESTGTQWIDIGTTIDTSTDEIELYFQLTETNNYKWVFGEYDTNARLGLGSGDGTNKRNFLYQSGVKKLPDTEMYNVQHKYIINASGGFIDGVKKTDYAPFASTSTLYLFNINIDSTSDYKCKAKVWAYKQKRNGILIRDFIPVLDMNDVPCLYDKVSEKCFYNKGDGEFWYQEKPVEPELPYLKELEYLQGTGTQYIDTGKLAPLNTDIEVVFRLNSTEQSGANNGAIFGGRSAQTSNTCTLFYLASTSPQYFRFDRVGQPIVARADNFTIDKNSVYKFTYKNNVVSLANLTTAEERRLTIKEPSTFTTNTIQLFAVGGGTVFKGNIYSWKYWEDGELIQDFIPVLDLNNIPCMYDKISGEFFYNEGNGQFIYG